MIDLSAECGSAVAYGDAGCRRGPSSIASEVTFTKAASNTNAHNVGRARIAARTSEVASLSVSAVSHGAGSALDPGVRRAPSSDVD